MSEQNEAQSPASLFLETTKRQDRFTQQVEEESSSSSSGELSVCLTSVYEKEFCDAILMHDRRKESGFGTQTDIEFGRRSLLVAVIILNWNGSENTLECLESLGRVSYPRLSVFVVDNGSSDDSVVQIKQRFPSVHVIETGKNLGYAAGNNIGIGTASKLSPNYYLLLNNDVIVDPEFIRTVVYGGETVTSAGILGPAIYSYSNPKVIQSLGAKVNIWSGTMKALSANQTDANQTEPHEVDYVSGAAFFIKTGVIKKIGLMPESYFLYSEEVDYCMMARRAGFRVMVVPRAKIWHKGSKSLSRAAGAKEYYLNRSRFIFEKKFATPVQLLVFSEWFLLATLPERAMMHIKAKDGWSMLNLLRGFCAGLAVLSKTEYHESRWELA